MECKDIGYILSALLFSLKVGGIQASETCRSFNRNTGNYEDMWCNDYCCTSNESCCSASLARFVGFVIGGTIVLIMIIAIVLIGCKKHNARKRSVVHPHQDTALTHTTVSHVQGSPQQPVAPPPYPGGPKPGPGQYPPPEQYPPQPQQQSMCPSPPPRYPPPPLRYPPPPPY